MKTHYGDTHPACNTASLTDMLLTLDEELVTCQRCTLRECTSCERKLPASAFPKFSGSVYSRRRATCRDCGPVVRGDSSFRGLGKLACQICGGVLADHPVGPRCEADL